MALDTVLLGEHHMSWKLGPMLRRLRRSHKMSLRELARRAKVPPGYLSELEQGKKANPSAVVVVRLAKALNVSVGKLLE
jgi:transcriptional regulator with XRE-family HTH domain